jgi:hypothetical protein
MNNVPTSSSLMVRVITQLEKSMGAPSFKDVQGAVKHLNDKMPMSMNSGLVSETHELTMVLSQTSDLGLIFKYNEIYLVTEKGKKIVYGEG